jgi:hypothetical protein
MSILSELGYLSEVKSAKLVKIKMETKGKEQPK